MRRLGPLLLTIAALSGPALAQGVPPNPFASNLPSVPPDSATVRSPRPPAIVPDGALAEKRDRIRACNASAGGQGLVGEGRRRFMTECIAGRIDAVPPPARQPSPRQARMKACNGEAAERRLRGEERSDFMTACLRG